MPANTYGRQVVLPLTNKSGGGVIAGDVVIVDTTNNDAFTTTTSAGFTGGVGIAQETIANNAIGRVLFSGYAALVNVNASVTRGHYGKTHTVAKQATDAGAGRGVGTFCQFLTGGTTPDAVMYPVDLLGSSLTNPMTTTGDLIYSSDNSGTPARLAATTSGYVLTAQGAGVAPVWAAAAGGITHAYIGYNSIGASTENLVDLRQYMKKVTLASACVITSVGVYVKQITNGAVAGFAVGVLTDSAGDPAEVIGYANSGAGSTFLSQSNGSAGAARWVHTPLGLYVASGDYWLAVTITGTAATHQLYYDGSGGDRYYTNGAFRVTDSGWTAVTTSSNKYSIRASTIA